MGTETLERELVRDLQEMDERFADDEFSSELYRALANNVWRKQGGPDGHISLSWSRAEEIVNELRARVGAEPLTLAQTGGEGEVSRTVAEELGRRGWTSTPLNTGRQDPEHATRPESPPPPGKGEEQSPVDDSRAWEWRAHEEAEMPAGPTSGEGAGGGRTQPDKA
jgi:hypothetical protein